jgi:hypothetical protein
VSPLSSSSADSYNRLFVSPYIIVLALALTAICIYLAKFYINGAREVKRLEVLHPPISLFLGASITDILVLAIV